MAKQIRKKILGDSAYFKITSASPGKKIKKSITYNVLSLIIKFNKSISISVFIILSGFLFVYCSTAPSDVAVEEQIQAPQSTVKESAEINNIEITISEKSISEPDLSNILSIQNLAYSDDKLHGIFWSEHDFKSKVYLSFDDGPNMSLINTESSEKTVSDTILDILQERNLKAVFFINGKNLEFENPSDKNELNRVILRIINEGHLIGNHSYNHYNLAHGRYIDGVDDQKEIALEFILTQESLNNLLGFEYPLILVRPPYAEPGRTDDLDNWLISEKQYLISLQFDSYDYAYKEKGYWNNITIIERMETLLSEKKEGGVLLLHELESTALFLTDLLDSIILEKGYAVESMEELLEKKYGQKS
jgi:peptidoglycan/xylan/chitin deacetylase (PgdA/CDA1 family)